ncbi:hypothetical protein DPMN_010763 [Dreissena polymorpha]|uniref:Uncharacterized protein n=1 Tax=Dreissena polymorpha TaxID=45954 RepID=A0A9D4N2S2_DREPO|nr:hypothetical protein DPMN_010763 [Dreissena polymorpha]
MRAWGIRDGGPNGKVEDHAQQYKQHQCRHHHERREAGKEVTNFKFLGTNMSKDDFNNAKVRIRIAIATAAKANLSKLWPSSSFGLQLRYIEDTREHRTQDICLFKHVTLKTVPHLLHVVQDQQVCSEHNSNTFFVPQKLLLATVKQRYLVLMSFSRQPTAYLTGGGSLCHFPLTVLPVNGMIIMLMMILQLS